MTLDAFYLHGMRLAYAEAEKAAAEGEVPAGCVILPAPPDLFPELFAPSTQWGTGKCVPRCQAQRAVEGTGKCVPRCQAQRAVEGTGKCVLRCPPLLGRAHNQTETLCDATAHAEMQAITQAASALGDWRLERTVLFTTKEPCPMCAGAIVLSRVPVVVYGLSDPKRGGQSVFGILDHPGLIHRARIVPGILEPECHEQMSSFFKARREGLLNKPQ